MAGWGQREQEPARAWCEPVAEKAGREDVGEEGWEAQTCAGGWSSVSVQMLRAVAKSEVLPGFLQQAVGAPPASVSERGGGRWVVEKV